MRSLILLAVTWIAGTWLFAAERTPTPSSSSPPAALTQTPAEPAQAGTSDATPESAPSEATQTNASEDTLASDASADEPAEPAAAQPSEEPKVDKSAEGASAADTKSAKGSPQRFVPSEQVRADFDVSFPIDI